MLGSRNDEPPITPRAPARAGKRGQRHLLLRDNVLILAQLTKDWAPSLAEPEMA
jgi:hypothetical protein